MSAAASSTAAATTSTSALNSSSSPAAIVAAAIVGGMTGSGAGAAKNYKQLGEEAWKRCEKVNGELFALTYGVFVAQLLRDYEDGAQVNAQLEKLGYSIGIRLIDEFLARASTAGWQPRCTDFSESAEVLAKVAFKQFLNVTPTISSRAADGREFVLSFAPGESGGGDGLGSEMVELPESAIKSGLHYSNILCGVIRGAMEMVNVQVECEIVNDLLLHPQAASTDLRVTLVKYLEEELSLGE